MPNKKSAFINFTEKFGVISAQGRLMNIYNFFLELKNNKN
jgi:hypothetical protein